MKMPGLHTATLLPALLLAPLWLSAAASAKELPSITVNGAGSVEARPDMAIVSAGTVSQAEHVATVLAQNNEKVSKILALAKASGIAEADVQTENVSIQPVYRDRRDDAKLPAIAGYRISNPISIRLRMLDRLGELLDSPY